MNCTANNNLKYEPAVNLPYGFKIIEYTTLAKSAKQNVAPKIKLCSDKILLKLQQQNRWIDVNNIIRLQAESNYTKLYLLNRTEPVLMAKSLKYFVHQLDDTRFIRVHRSHLVNSSYVKAFCRFNKPCLLLKDGTRLQIARRRLKAIKLFYKKKLK